MSPLLAGFFTSSRVVAFSLLTWQDWYLGKWVPSLWPILSRALVARNAHWASILPWNTSHRVCQVKPEYERHHAIDTLCAVVKFNASLVMSITSCRATLSRFSLIFRFLCLEKNAHQTLDSPCDSQSMIHHSRSSRRYQVDRGRSLFVTIFQCSANLSSEARSKILLKVRLRIDRKKQFYYSLDRPKFSLRKAPPFRSFLSQKLSVSRRVRRGNVNSKLLREPVGINSSHGNWDALCKLTK